MKHIDEMLGLLHIVILVVYHLAHSHVARPHYRLRYRYHMVGILAYVKVLYGNLRVHFPYTVAAVHRVCRFNRSVLESRHHHRDLKRRAWFWRISKRYRLDLAISRVGASCQVHNRLDFSRTDLHHYHRALVRVKSRHLSSQRLLADVLYIHIQCCLDIRSVLSRHIRLQYDNACHFLIMSSSRSSLQVTIESPLHTILRTLVLRVSDCYGSK